MPPASRAARAPTACSVKQVSPLMTMRGSKSCATCSRCGLAKMRRSAVRSINCVASRACGSANSMNSCQAVMASNGDAATTIPRDFGTARYAQPLPLRGDLLPLWPVRGRRAGGRLCAGHRLSAHRQAALVRLRRRRSLQVRDRCARGVSQSPASGSRASSTDEPRRCGPPRLPRRLSQAPLLGRIIPSIEEVLAAGEHRPARRRPKTQCPAFPDPEPIGDAGHRG